MNVLGMFRLDGKVALVTGARRGIGKAMALGLAEAGADIIAVSANLEASAVKSKRRSRRWAVPSPATAATFPIAMTSTASSPRVKADCPAIDILVNNAGTVLREPAERHPDEYWDKIINTNLSAQFVLSREIGKGMLARGAGKIIFTASLLTFQAASPCPATRRARAASAN